jgi:TfoX/Sxy family transcriptional regulator of competence genes
MSTKKDIAEYILERLGNNNRFHTRAMFGEYALYVDGKVVGLICNDQLYLKILSASQELENICEKDSPYKGAKMYYLIEESQYWDVADILIAIADELPTPKKKNKR